MIDVLVKLLNWFFNTFERRWGLHLGRKHAPRGKSCPACGGEGILADSGDVCPGCQGSGRVDT